MGKKEQMIDKARIYAFAASQAKEASCTDSLQLAAQYTSEALRYILYAYWYCSKFGLETPKVRDVDTQRLYFDYCGSSDEDYSNYPAVKATVDCGAAYTDGVPVETRKDNIKAALHAFDCVYTDVTGKHLFIECVT